MDQNINDSKSHICNSFFENIISGIQPFYSRLHLTKRIIRKSQTQQKLTKKITHFTILLHSKNLTHFTNLNSIDIENNMLSKLNHKPSSLYKFSSKHVSVWCQKNYLHWTISWDTRTAFLKHWWDRGGGRLNNVLKATCCLDLVTCFQHLNVSIYSINTENFQTI